MSQKKSIQEKSQQLLMFPSEGVNVWQQLLLLFAFGGGLEKVENASRGLRSRAENRPLSRSLVQWSRVQDTRCCPTTEHMRCLDMKHISLI